MNHSYIIADHIRSSAVIIADGISPGPKQRGYILRRLIRKALSASLSLDIDISDRAYYEDLIDSIINIYDGVYENIKEIRDYIIDTIFQEAQKYQKSINVGVKEWDKYIRKDKSTNPNDLAGYVWDLYQTHGVPLEVSDSILHDKELEYDQSKLEELIESHQNLSQTVSKGEFKSGLGEQTENTIKLHTLTHLIHYGLRKILGPEVKQIGSAITDQKARFDFISDVKLDDDQVEELEDLLEDIIEEGYEVSSQDMSEKEARELGAIGLFGEKYGDIVTIYTISLEDDVISREFCGGPHVKNTTEIGDFEIVKQKSIGSGKKRIEFKLD